MKGMLNVVTSVVVMGLTSMDGDKPPFQLKLITECTVVSNRVTTLTGTSTTLFGGIDNRVTAFQYVSSSYELAIVADALTPFECCITAIACGEGEKGGKSDTFVAVAELLHSVAVFRLQEQSLRLIAVDQRKTRVCCSLGMLAVMEDHYPLVVCVDQEANEIVIISPEKDVQKKDCVDCKGISNLAQMSVISRVKNTFIRETVIRAQIVSPNKVAVFGSEGSVGICCLDHTIATAYNDCL